MRKNYSKALFLFSVLITILIIGCKRESVLDNPIDPILPPPTTITVVNDLTQVTASVSGIVLDESNAPIANAVVTSGAAATTTNSNGMFIFQSISLSKENGSVTVVKAGYFKGIRSFKTTAGKNHTVRLQLMQKVLSGTVSAAAGGTINSNGGASIIFPAAAFVTSTGAAYTGTVNVYSRWINPTAANLPFIIPGDLRGISTNGAENILETYGMVGTELEDASGNTLKIATGKKATISFPLPASLQASAPATIQLWHFDDATARWKENGTATKSGSTYIAQVDKFSFWNCDVGSPNFVNIDFTVLNASNNSPIASAFIKLKTVSGGSYAYGITNNAGFVSGLVPKNTPLILEMISSCGTILYTQNINAISVNTSLGNINSTPATSQILTFIGTVLGCNAAPVTNGYVSIYVPGGGGYALTNAAGAFSYSFINCTGASLMFECYAVDISNSQLSNPISGTTSAGTVNLGNMNTCGNGMNPDVYVAGAVGNKAVVWKNGIATNLTNGLYAAQANAVFVSGTDVYVAGYEGSNFGDVAKVWKNGVPTNLAGGLTNGMSQYAYANSVFVSGTDVYVAVYALNSAVIWKNGVSTTLAGGTANNYAQAFSIFGSGPDVYAAGTSTLPVPNNRAATVWKNGIATNLTTGLYAAQANAVLVSGTDVYAAGYEGSNFGDIAKVWKNGVATTLSNYMSDAYSVFISGTDVYVGGKQRLSNAPGNIPELPTVWKNGVASSLSNSAGEANSVFVYGTDVYVAGTGYSGNISAAKVWKNGLPVNINNSAGAYGSVAKSLFVK